MAAGSTGATTAAAVRLLGMRDFGFALPTGPETGFPITLRLGFLATIARAIF
jgi:hypothetical protein